MHDVLARVAYLPFVLQNDVFIDALFGVNVLQVKGAMSMALSCSVQSVSHSPSRVWGRPTSED